MNNYSCFKAYDIRGQLGRELNVDVAYRIGRAYAQFLKPKTVVVGGDARNSSLPLKTALTSGLRDEGCEVLDIGLCGTEEVYFATPHFSADGGIMVTASHNPIDYNGMKLVREESRPISGDSGLREIKMIAERGEFLPTSSQGRGAYRRVSSFEAYLQHMVSFVDVAKLVPLKIVVNAGNGAAASVIDGLEGLLPFELIKVHHEPNGEFPNGSPNPLLPENRHATQAAILAHHADLGVAWDGDFDRCFLFDEKGVFIEGYYIVGLLAEAFLKKNQSQHRREKIVHDPRLVWNTAAICNQYQADAICSKTGHAFIKELMRRENAIYAGEMSAHHYFRDFHFCDSGMIPWLLIAEMLSIKQQPMSTLVSEAIDAYPCSGEINIDVSDAKPAIGKVLARYECEANSVDQTDGVSLDMGQWRFNLRMSNTEPVVRLNVEARKDHSLMKAKTAELIALLR